MKTREVRLSLENGLEARPIALLVQEANKYDSTVYIEADGRKVNAKSIMGMMTMGLDNGAQLRITADGADEDAAIENIEKFLNGAM